MSTDPHTTRPPGAPAYYLGRPASLWVATAARNRRAAGRHHLPAARTARQATAGTADQQIAVDDPRKPDVRALLDRHLAFARAQTPPEHSFALNVADLLDPAITVFTARAHGRLLGIGAIKRIGPQHAEIKSMHVAEAARGRGTGRAMLTHLLKAARARGLRRVSLETGTTPAFAAARALYHSAGFVPSGPFAGYPASENNLFMTLELGAACSCRGARCGVDRTRPPAPV